MKAFFLDFDGVIVDSIKECYLISKDLYYGFTNINSNDNHRKTFYKFRGLVNPPSEYLVLHKAIEYYSKDNSIDFESRFNELKSAIAQSEKKKFEYLFFQLRKYYQKDIDNWLLLHRVTRFGMSLLDKKLPNYFIITTKNRESVKLLLDYYKIRITGIFDIKDYKKFGSKGKMISNFLDNSEYDQAVFIDDSVENLSSVGDERIKCFFADWGYGTNTIYEKFKF